jgi:enolase-phosphatase E1
MTYPLSVRGILLDIEGTTSSISFVYDVMFPYVRDNVSEFLKHNWNEPSVQTSVTMLADDLEKDTQQWLGNLSDEEKQEAVAAGVIELMDDDVKATGLKKLQGLIWKDGFHSGEMVAHIYDDVADSIRSWNQQNIDVRIYSSGSIQAQKLFFGHTVAGDLLDQFKGHYDTTTGPKQSSDSYCAIASEFSCQPIEILFISDVIEELKAAKKAGLQTLLSIRPGNKAVESDHGFTSITSFAQVKLIEDKLTS